MRLLVCGSREWRDVTRIYAEMFSLLKARDVDVVIHGAARGADATANATADRLGVCVLAFPADWKLHGAKAGPIRNARMLREGKPDRGLAFGRIKIGMATSVRIRLNNMQSDAPHPIDLLAVVPGAAEEERAYHDRFVAHRLHGEWFEMVPEIMDIVVAIRSRGP